MGFVENLDILGSALGICKAYDPISTAELYFLCKGFKTYAGLTVKILAGQSTDSFQVLMMTWWGEHRIKLLDSLNSLS